MSETADSPAPGDDQTDDAAVESGSAASVPEIELALYQVSVRVKGQEDDDLADVEETATALVDHLVECASTLEEEPDQRGLG